MRLQTFFLHDMRRWQRNTISWLSASKHRLPSCGAQSLEDEKNEHQTTVGVNRNANFKMHVALIGLISDPASESDRQPKSS
jgi:hypothetical protein